jgi:hypothetical protein
MKQITLHSEEVHTKETGTKEGQTVSYKHLKDSMMLSKFNTLGTGLLNCLNARSRGLIQSEVRFL